MQSAEPLHNSTRTNPPIAVPRLEGPCMPAERVALAQETAERRALTQYNCRALSSYTVCPGPMPPLASPRFVGALSQPGRAANVAHSLYEIWGPHTKAWSCCPHQVQVRITAQGHLPRIFSWARSLFTPTYVHNHIRTGTKVLGASHNSTGTSGPQMLYTLT